MTDIVHLKLKTGEEIIGIKSNETTNAYYLEKVRSIAVQPMGNGQAGIGFIPFMMGCPDGEIRIPATEVIAEPQVALSKNMEDGYLQQVSPIDLAGNIQI